MGFSFRSIFQSSSASREPLDASLPSYPQFPSSAAAFEPVPSMHPAPPLNASHSPFSAANPLFRTVAGEAIAPAPPAQSPFATPATSNTSSPLTVGDVLPQLPPDVVRFGALSPDQPVAIAPATLDAALRSGQAALPIFEIYRVCPALFQTPVSPQDPRTVPLPAAKLARLIASAHQAGPGAPALEIPAPLPPASLPQSPFAAVTPSPFGVAEPTAPASPAFGFGTPLPPRREEPAPSPVEPPVTESAPVASPFALAAPAVINGASAFSFKPEDPLPAKPHLFTPAAEPLPGSPPPSPFGVPPAPPPAAPATPTPSIFGNGPPASPFASPGAQAAAHVHASPPAPAPAPVEAPPAPVSAPPASPAPSPFGGFFATPAAPDPAPAPAPIQPIQLIRPNPGISIFGPTPAATPPNTPAAEPAAAPPAPPASPFPPAPPAPPAPGFAGTFRVSLASLLKGYSAEELGFDPSIVPAFIMTALPSGHMRDQIASGSPSSELGLLVDGITDIGFRNVLSHAKRDFQLRLPLAELTSALAAANAPAGLPTTVPGSSPPAPQSMRVEPPSASAAMAPAAPAAAPASSFFAPAEPKTDPLPGLAVPLFGAAPEPETRSDPQPAPGLPVPQPVAEKPSLPPSQTALPQSAVRATPSDPFAAPLPAAVRPASPPEPEAETPAAPTALSSPFLAPPPAFPAAEAPAQDSGDDASASPWTAPPAAPRNRPSASFPEAKPMVPALFEEAPATAPAAPPRKPAATRAHAPASTLGLQPLDTSSEQILLRALLGTDEDLAPQRVVELTGQLPGIAACVCLQGQKTLSHAGAHKPQAREFQRQAADLAHHLRTLGPLIGIEGAETFTLNAGDRLMTFCFPEGAILGVLHDAEPSLGLRDKITLIARELSRMLAD